MTNKFRNRVVKVGGSLFVREDCFERLNKFLATQTSGQTIVIAGGGELVDVIRQWDKRFCLGEPASHRMSCQLMSVTAALVAEKIYNSQAVDRIDQLAVPTCGDIQPRTVVFDPSRWILKQSVPASWETTSDSIAAQLCRQLGDCELVLLKSILPNVSGTNPATCSIGSAAEQGVVDNSFFQIAQSIRSIKIVNLAADPFAEMKLQP